MRTQRYLSTPILRMKDDLVARQRSPPTPTRQPASWEATRTTPSIHSWRSQHESEEYAHVFLGLVLADFCEIRSCF